MLISEKRTTKALIRLRGCAGWSAPLLFANLRRQVFSLRDPDCHDLKDFSDNVMLILSLPFLVLKMLSAAWAYSALQTRFYHQSKYNEL